MTKRRFSLRQLTWAFLGLMAVLFLVVSVSSVIGRLTVERAVGELSGTVMPLQQEADALRRAYTDQETGQRGFMLTGNPVSLEQYDAGAATAERLQAELRAQFADNPPYLEHLDSVMAAATAWKTQAAEPQIAARRAGPIAADRQAAMALQGKTLFDDLRGQLRGLSDHVDEMAQAQLARITSAQRVANIIQAAGVLVVAAVIVAALIEARRQLMRPVNNLLEEVKAVADGDYDQPIHSTGSRETAELAHAVDQMRESLRASTDRLIDSELRDEQARIAADLHDRVIQRVFGLGLGLTSASARQNPDLQGFIDETDAIIHDLREVVFNLHQSIAHPVRSTRLRSAIIDVVEGSVAALGFTPTLQFDGPIDDAHVRPELHAAVLAVVRESLSNVARHSKCTTASVNVVVTGVDLRITVRDNGVGVSEDDVMGHGRHNIYMRAKNLGGTAKIYNASPGPGTVVEWVVPLDAQQ